MAVAEKVAALEQAVRWAVVVVAGEGKVVSVATDTTADARVVMEGAEAGMVVTEGGSSRSHTSADTGS